VRSTSVSDEKLRSSSPPWPYSLEASVGED
jgi:hypothetical protein